MTLPIFYEATSIAHIEPGAEGAQIRYEPEWQARREAFPISLTMPLDQELWASEITTPWLMNLLPEGDPLRAMTRALGVSRDDILGLIARAGGDLAGAVTIGAPRQGEVAAYRQITHPGDLERIIEELPAKPFLIGDDGVSMSLAGAQEKLPVALIDDAVAIPVNGAPSTHILKPDNDRLLGSVQNEALCMVLARRCGLSVAPVTTGIAGKRAYLLVDRYDREVLPGTVRRLHQEDFCQALGRPPAAKYQHNSSGIAGPSLVDMFTLTRTNMTARDINRLLDAVIFNIAIGNVDSHAKNYSILLKPRRVELAPLYDLMSGLAWPNITQNHAQDIGGPRRGRHVYARHWRRMAEACGLAKPATVRRVIEVSGRILVELPNATEEVAAMPAGGSERLHIFAEAIGERARLVQANAGREGDDYVEPPFDSNDAGITYGEA